MRNTKVKQVRKNIIKYPEDILIQIRNHCGSKTKDMGQRQVYQNAKKLYCRGNLKLRR